MTSSYKILPKNGIFIFWHKHIFAVIAFLSCYSKLHNITALVSGSEDGKMLQLVLKALHFRVIEGSSSEGGYSSLLNLHRNVKDNEIILITPDGPTGPTGILKPGAFHLARFSGKPITAIHVEYGSCWQAHSWDRAFIPKPFSKCEIAFSDSLLLNREAPAYEMTELENKLESSLNGNQSCRRMEKSLH